MMNGEGGLAESGGRFCSEIGTLRNGKKPLEFIPSGISAKF